MLNLMLTQSITIPAKIPTTENRASLRIVAALVLILSNSPIHQPLVFSKTNDLRGRVVFA